MTQQGLPFPEKNFKVHFDVGQKQSHMITSRTLDFGTKASFNVIVHEPGPKIWPVGTTQEDKR